MARQFAFLFYLIDLYEVQWADLIYQGLWFGPLKDALDGFMDRTQQHVNGVVRLKLHKGNATVTGRGSVDSSLYVMAAGQIVHDGDRSEFTNGSRSYSTV